MKWHAQWWGIQLIAETEEDAVQLRALSAALPRYAEEVYEVGKIETGNTLLGESQDGIGYVPFVIIFER